MNAILLARRNSTVDEYDRMAETGILTRTDRLNHSSEQQPDFAILQRHIGRDTRAQSDQSGPASALRCEVRRALLPPSRSSLIGKCSSRLSD